MEMDNRFRSANGFCLGLMGGAHYLGASTVFAHRESTITAVGLEDNRWKAGLQFSGCLIYNDVSQRWISSHC
jgi:hypothetical protein